MNAWEILQVLSDLTEAVKEIHSVCFTLISHDEARLVCAAELLDKAEDTLDKWCRLLDEPKAHTTADSVAT